MSRSKRGGKARGTEFWASRGGGIADGQSSGSPNSKKWKVLTHKKERRMQQADLRKKLKEE